MVKSEADRQNRPDPGSNSTMMKSEDMSFDEKSFQFDYDEIRRSLSEYSESVTSCFNSTMMKSEGHH